MSDSLESLLGRAARLRRAGRTDEALAAYEQLLARWPDLPDSWFNLALLQRRAGRPDAALASYRQALDRGVEGPEEVRLNRAVILTDDLGRHAEAEAELAAALAINPRYVPALLNLGNLREDLGRREAAREAYDRILALEPGHALALARLAGLIAPRGPDDPMIDRLRSALAAPAPPADRAALGFALARMLDAAGDFDGAFEAAAAANAASRAAAPPGTGRYDRSAQEALVEALIAAFPEPAPRPAADAAPGPAPVFVCGMFRSGSTLVEQVLAGHPRVAAGGELDLLPALAREALPRWPLGLAEAPAESLAARYREGLLARFPGAGLVTDKRPDNILHVGLIKRMFPAAKIVHTVRAPVDNALSVFFLHLDPGMAYALDLMDAGHFLAQERRLAAHWRTLYPDDVLDFDYDAFVADPAPALARLTAFLGLAPDAGMLDAHRRAGAVKTASVWQVREPLHRRASGRADRYARQTAALRAWFREAGL
ncbi:MAG: tetratricopeptide repeat-containing sulfotransferase family protein [Pseudomonadota bacterium]